MFKSTFFRVLLLAVVVLGVPGAVIGYWYVTSRPSYLLKKGHEALQKMARAEDRDSAEAEAREAGRLILLLDKKGYTQAARLLRGESQVYAGEYTLQNEGAASREYYRNALADLTRIQDDGPIGVQATVLAAECLIRLGQQRLAAEGLTAILKRDSNNKDAHRFLAAIYIDLNSAKDAVEYLEEWGRLDPSDGLPYRWIGFFKKDQEVVAAREAYEEALRRELRQDVRNDVLKELAETYIQQGDYQRALDTLEQGGENFFQAPEILALRVECLRATDQKQEAEQLLAGALQKDPDFVPGLLLLAAGYRTEDQPQKARPLLEKVLQKEPYNLTAGTQLMEVCLQLHDQARADELKKRNDETRLMITELKEKLEPRASRELWNDAVRLRIGEMYLKLSRQQDARMWLEACLACNPNNQKARQLLSQIPRKGELKGRPSAGSLQKG